MAAPIIAAAAAALKAAAPYILAGIKWVAKEAVKEVVILAVMDAATDALTLVVTSEQERATEAFYRELELRLSKADYELVMRNRELFENQYYSKLNSILSAASNDAYANDDLAPYVSDLSINYAYLDGDSSLSNAANLSYRSTGQVLHSE